MGNRIKVSITREGSCDLIRFGTDRYSTAFNVQYLDEAKREWLRDVLDNQLNNLVDDIIRRERERVKKHFDSIFSGD